VLIRIRLLQPKSGVSGTHFWLELYNGEELVRDLTVVVVQDTRESDELLEAAQKAAPALLGVSAKTRIEVAS